MPRFSFSTVVVFDWDGTIFDTDFLIDLAIETVLARHDPEELQRLMPVFYTSHRHTSPLKSLRLQPHGREAIIKEIAAQLHALERRACAFEGGRELVQHLKELGVPLAILTRRDRVSLCAQLKRAGLHDVFDVLLCRGEVASKPDPAGLLLIRRTLAVAHVVMVGNSMDDLLCAQRSGAEFVAVNLCKRVREPQIDEQSSCVLSDYDAVRRAVLERLH
ncbi:HAD family hydrolase [Pseudomonas sp. L13]|uniref:HAD family hydrolase n=1 Tax=Pseudomonas sp. L13 TaxID=343985 RepID=UPI00137ACE14|nr:HAD family hydrolase [Pseudomonas sp. L13]NCE90226.1 hypothetical protein [Pseudomonas sp. L13]